MKQREKLELGTVSLKNNFHKNLMVAFSETVKNCNLGQIRGQGGAKRGPMGPILTTPLELDTASLKTNFHPNPG